MAPELRQEGQRLRGWPGGCLLGHFVLKRQGHVSDGMQATACPRGQAAA